MNKNEYKKIIKFLQSHFPNHNIPAETFKVWFIVFERLDYNAVVLRILDAVENEKFMPYPQYFCNETYDGYKFYLDNGCMSESMAKNLSRIKKAVG